MIRDPCSRYSDACTKPFAASSSQPVNIRRSEIDISPREIAFLCQKVENLMAGAPCGVMDQMTAACGEADHLLLLLCQPGDLKGTLVLPDELAVWGLTPAFAIPLAATITAPCGRPHSWATE